MACNRDRKKGSTFAYVLIALLTAIFGSFLAPVAVHIATAEYDRWRNSDQEKQSVAQPVKGEADKNDIVIAEAFRQ